MKPTYRTRTRSRRPARSNDVAFFKKESSESAFFDTPAPAPFFGMAQIPVQRKCDKCEKDEKMQQPDKKKEEDKKVQRKESAPVPGMATAASVMGALTSASQALPTNLSYSFSSRIGHNLTSTRIHTGSKAAQSAKALNAKAYTVGNHIVFGDYQYNPDTPDGKRLIAHELAHVVQQQYGAVGIYRMPADEPKDAPTSPVVGEKPPERETPVATFGSGETQYENKIDYANCEGVNVRGLTSANYSHSYTYAGESTTAGSNCSGCSGSSCITESGTITSTFNANPVVTLPAVPAGLSECEAAAVQNAINTTLAAHEQQHVDAFNTYVGTETTPYTYNGCVGGRNAFIRARHNSIESARRTASNALSAALDANGANNFTITCNCPDPAASSESE